ncbi:hypothetical protein J6590_061335 [Homalodisca vitripennis]|nr:hypothetical protein J6590_061335 [Homalodisca vitripennis]
MVRYENKTKVIRHRRREPNYLSVAKPINPLLNRFSFIPDIDRTYVELGKKIWTKVKPNYPGTHIRATREDDRLKAVVNKNLGLFNVSPQSNKWQQKGSL